MREKRAQERKDMEEARQRVREEAEIQKKLLKVPTHSWYRWVIWRTKV